MAARRSTIRSMAGDATGLVTSVFFLDQFAMRQWDDPNYSGAKLTCDAQNPCSAWQSPAPSLRPEATVAERTHTSHLLPLAAATRRSWYGVCMRRTRAARHWRRATRRSASTCSFPTSPARNCPLCASPSTTSICCAPGAPACIAPATRAATRRPHSLTAPPARVIGTATGPVPTYPSTTRERCEEEVGLPKCSGGARRPALPCAAPMDADVPRRYKSRTPAELPILTRWFPVRALARPPCVWRPKAPPTHCRSLAHNYPQLVDRPGWRAAGRGTIRATHTHQLL